MKNVIAILFLVGMASAWVKKMENSALYQGDILLDPDEDERDQHGFASIKGGRWPGARIPYRIDSSLNQAAVNSIFAAINDYHYYTCLRFHKWGGEGAYLNFFAGAG